MKIIYLYAEVMGYTLATMEVLSNFYDAELHVIHWDTKKLTPFQIQENNKINYYSYSETSTSDIQKMIKMIKPNLIVVSGWRDRKYLQAAKAARKLKIPVIVGFDTQWEKSLKQHIFVLFKYFLKQYFTHAWVPGSYQFEYARKLGFHKNNILFDLYSANTNLYNQSYLNYHSSKQVKYPHKFIFVGRFEKVKGIHLLVKAWQKLSNRKKDWELICIGNGSLKTLLTDQKDIIVKDFMQPEELCKEVAASGCFLLPSNYEPWGVVVHEFTTAGLPIICSDICGSAESLIINGFNGYKFEQNNVLSLIQYMEKIINTPDESLYKMAVNSHEISKKISSKTSAANLISIIS